MTKGWQIVVSVVRPDREEPNAEHYIVAAADQEKAVALIRRKVNLLPSARVLVFGEASEQMMAFLNAKRGEVYAVSAVV